MFSNEVAWKLPFNLKMHNSINEALQPDVCGESEPTWPACSCTVGGVQSTSKIPHRLSGRT